MASKTEIIDAIRAGVNRAEATFSGLTDAQLDTKIHDGPNGWTARQILAHLAGRQDTYDLLIQLALESHGAPPGGPDMDTWNQQLLIDRQNRRKEDLLREFRQVQNRLIHRVEVMREDQLNRTLVLPNRETTLGDALLGSGGMHPIQHAEEVEQALDLPS